MTPHEALSIILESIPTAPSEAVNLANASGRILAEPIFADRPFPAFDRVMMDGVALNSKTLADGQRTFSIVDLARAGDPAKRLENAAACMRVNTGAVLPEGCDQVVPIEQVVEDSDESITLDASGTANAYEFVHRAGSDFDEGAALISPGATIGAKEIGVLASVGKATVLISKPAKLTLISSGDELVDVDQEPLLHQIRRSNSHAIQAACAALKIEAEQRHIPDNPKAIESALAEIIESGNWIVLSGGISKGTHDFIPETLEKLGAEKRFQWVKQRPGKPMAFYQTPQGAPILALPGNPMSTLACFHRYGVPAIQKHLGITRSTTRPVKIAEAFTFKKPLALFLPVSLTHSPNGTTTAHAIPTQNSGDFASIMATDGFIELPANRDTFEAGEAFTFFPWL